MNLQLRPTFSILAVLAGIGLTSCGDQSSDAALSRKPVDTQVTVHIEDGAFKLGHHSLVSEPLFVERGTTVTWINRDRVAHTVTSSDGAVALNSKELRPGESYAFRFTEIGDFAYFSEPHPDLQGVVRVQETQTQEQQQQQQQGQQEEPQPEEPTEEPSPSPTASPSPSPSPSPSVSPSPSPSVSPSPSPSVSPSPATSMTP